MRSAKTVDGVRTEYFYSDGLLLRETQTDAEGDLVYTVSFTYDESGRPFSAKHNGNTYYYVYDVYGNVKYLYDAAGNLALEYAYRDPWGGAASYTVGTSGNTTAHTQIAELNPFRYKGYYYDADLDMYYCGSRYYDPETCRWINADNQLSTGSDLTGMNLFVYCGNNPVNRIDPTGEAWWHWVLGAAVVAACAVATVVTCGGFAAAATAVCMVGSGVAAATTASTVAAAAFIGSATVYGTTVLAAASSSNSIEEFNAQGNWGTVAATAGGAVFNGAEAYAATRTTTTTVYRSVSSAEAQDIKNTGQFNLAPGGMESKQFGFNLSETSQFGNMMGQNTIVSAKVPNSMLNQLYTGGVDTSIFRAGTLTVYGDQLGAFNQAVSGTIKFMP